MTTFIGTGTNERASVILIGAPYDGTVAIRAGCRTGPGRIRELSHVLEDFSYPLKKGFSSRQVTDAGDIDLTGLSPQDVVSEVKVHTEQILRRGQIPVWVGGEHLISAGAIFAAAEQYADLAVIIVDAHADLRDEYEGQTWSHATVTRRIAERIGQDRVFLLGVRSGSQEDYDYLASTNITDLPFTASGVSDLKGLVAGRHVYVSVDIDVIDPAAAPGTGSPEPGGPMSREALPLLLSLASEQIVGFDLVEVSPIHDHADITSLLAARIIRDLITATLHRRRSVTP